MATMAADPVFLDTNVLVYASRPASVGHAAARTALARVEASGTSIWISQQVLREYLAVVTRPQANAPALPMTTAIADVRSFQSALEVADDGVSVFERLLELLATFPGAGRQVHDANIVATMLTHGVRRLLTFNAGDFQRFAGAIDVEALAISAPPHQG